MELRQKSRFDDISSLNGVNGVWNWGATASLYIDAQREIGAAKPRAFVGNEIVLRKVWELFSK